MLNFEWLYERKNGNVGNMKEEQLMGVCVRRLVP